MKDNIFNQIDRIENPRKKYRCFECAYRNGGFKPEFLTKNGYINKLCKFHREVK
jgi:hypothetical protein